VAEPEGVAVSPLYVDWPTVGGLIGAAELAWRPVLEDPCPLDA
jgi:hypothetical protein